jgi:hypothetical protein
MMISSIASIETSFAWSGSIASFNATCDIWFANAPPTSVYNDVIDGSVMIWVHDPEDYQPVGDFQETVAVAGHEWDVWFGHRGDGPDGYNPGPPVPFVSHGDIASLSFDLKDFLNEASAYGITSSMYLTDLFFGFQIWNGGAGGASVSTSSTCEVE